MAITKDQLDRYQSWASIASSIAIPVILAIVGYLVQRQLADEGLKKDYVSIAAGILKDNAAGQEPDVRKWAVQVLDANSPIPFSAKAKSSLEAGAAFVRSPFPDPPATCMIAPAKIDQLGGIQRLARSKDPFSKPAVVAYVEGVGKQLEAAARNAAHLECLQSWVKGMQQIGKEVWGQEGAANASSGAVGAAASAPR